MRENILRRFVTNKGATDQPVQSDQCLCYWLIGKYHIKTCYKRNFTILASLCSWADWFGYELVRNLNDSFSPVAAHMWGKIRSHICDIWGATCDFQQCGMCDQQRLRPACAYAQSDQSLCQSLEYSMSVKLLTKQHLEFLSLKGGCTGSCDSSLVKMPHFWKSHVVAHLWGNHLAEEDRESWFLFLLLLWCQCSDLFCVSSSQHLGLVCLFPGHTHLFFTAALAAVLISF